MLGIKLCKLSVIPVLGYVDLRQIKTADTNRREWTRNKHPDILPGHAAGNHCMSRHAPV
jgi:hypothetical protein